MEKQSQKVTNRMDRAILAALPSTPVAFLSAALKYAPDVGIGLC